MSARVLVCGGRDWCDILAMMTTMDDLNTKHGPFSLLIHGGAKGADVSPYTGRHTVSTQLVVNGVHPHIKDQILGHAADSMSRHYTNVPQAPLIEAIDTLPVPGVWRALPWLAAPLEWQSRLAEGTGRRTDLERAKG